MCFTETWLHRDISDQNVSVDGFHTVLSDRDCTESGKRKGGGLAVLVNSRWCKPGHITIKEQLCCPDVELLAIAHIICLERSHMSSLLSCTSLPLQTQHLPTAPYTPTSPSFKLNTPVPSSSCWETLTTSPWMQFCRHSNNTSAVLPERRGPWTLCMLTLRMHTSPLLSPLWAGQITTWFTSNPAMCLW